MTTPAGFDGLHRLAGEAARMARLFAVDQDAGRTFTGQDGTGLVTVSVTDACEVTDVALDPGWDRTIDPRMLGAAVVEAVGSATTHRLTEWADRVSDAADEPAEPAPPPAPRPVTINPSERVVEDLLYLLHRVGKETNPRERGRRPEPVAAPQRVRGRSDGGHVVVVLDGTTVVEVRVEINSRWLGGANHLEVASELRDAFEAAYRRARDEAPARRTGGAADELRALTADPQEFVARLFGLDR